ncbi:UNVERIFIED_CONTAM: T-lymphoma invasion and metastasis-inducing protein 2 [Gekko kuhli]
MSNVFYEDRESDYASKPSPKDIMLELILQSYSRRPQHYYRRIYDEIEIFPLSVYHVHLTKNEGVTDFGFAVTAQVDEHQHLTQIFVSDVLPDGMAFKEGLRVGNEILTINGKSVSDLDLRQMELLFSEKSVTLTLSTSHNSNTSALCTLWSDAGISKEARNLLPPPNQSQLLEEFLDNFKKSTTNGEMLLD